MGRKTKGEGTIFKDSNSYYVARIAVVKDSETGKKSIKYLKAKSRVRLLKK